MGRIRPRESSRDLQRMTLNVFSLSSVDYVIEFWGLISAWTGFCDTRAIPYASLADYLSFAATSGYHPTC
jgi:hypothetical protein